MRNFSVVTRIRQFLVNGALALVAAGWGGQAALAAVAYTPITPTMADKTVTLTGHDLTIEQVVQVARYGAKVELSPAARQREADNYGLLFIGSIVAPATNVRRSCSKGTRCRR
jgi:histidine ammonia-lyase